MLMIHIRHRIGQTPSDDKNLHRLWPGEVKIDYIFVNIYIQAWVMVLGLNFYKFFSYILITRLIGVKKLGTNITNYCYCWNTCPWV